MAESTALATLLPAALIDALRQRVIASPPRTSGGRHGRHRSQRAGLGLEFRDHRAYVPGDDLRRLDWRAAARQDRLILRQQEAEEELTATILLDAGGNMNYGAGEQNKWRHATALAGAVAWVVAQQHDHLRIAVGRDEHADTVGLLAAPRREQHARLVASCEQGPSGHCPWPKILDDAAASSRRRGVMVVISDFLDMAQQPSDNADVALEEACDKLSALRARGQHILLAQVLHRDETEFRWHENKVLRFEDLAGRRDVIEGVGAQLGEGFERRVAAYLAHLERATTTRGLGWLRLRTDAPSPTTSCACSVTTLANNW